MTKLLICGSRDASEAMKDTAWHAVERAKANGWTIVVGDAQGVDRAVVWACFQQGVVYDWYGITNQPRNLYTQNTMLRHWETIGTYHQINGNYLARDRVMVDAADACFAIWNGVSRGTIYTYNYAVKQGKQAWLRTFTDTPR